MKSLVELARSAAERWPDATALLFDASGERLTFADFDRRTNAMARAWRDLGVVPGDRVIVVAGNDPIFPLAWFSIVKAGAIMVPINSGYRSDDAGHLARLIDARAIICDAARIGLARSLLPVCRKDTVLVCPDGGEGDPLPGLTMDLNSFSEAFPTGPLDTAVASRDVASIQFTSGTSGLPKGCMLSHHYWLSLAEAVRSAVIELSPGETMLTAQAFSYLDPQWAFVLTLGAGARLVVLERFRPTELWSKIAAHEARFFYCLAAMPLMLLSVPPTPAERSHQLAVVMCSAIPPERHAEIEERFGVPWLEAYGTTETGSSLGMRLPEHDRTLGSGSIGTPIAPQRSRIVDEAFADVAAGEVGELLIAGPALMSGYWRDPEATAEAYHGEWYRTGDLAQHDRAGLYYLIGRSKDMIRRGGENIAAAEVENALQLHPAVLVAACIAVPDPIRNEEVKAFVTVSGPVDVADLAAFLDARLARFKIPRFWAIVDDLPMTLSARVAKSRLSRDLGDGVIDRLASDVERGKAHTG